jgi:cytochrome c553
MKIIRLHSLLHAAVLTIVFTAAGGAEEKSPDTISSQELHTKIAYCKTCHGVSGQGFRGSYSMPRLAGQQPEYLENQCGPLLSADGQTRSCLTWPTS